jgi:GLPGLI family protein
MKNMIKFIFFMLFIGYAYNASSQNLEKSIRVEYNTSMDFSAKFGGLFSRPSVTYSSRLLVSGSKASCILFNCKDITRNNYYFDSNNKSKLVIQSYNCTTNKTGIASVKENKMRKFKFTKESKKILGYTCYKALFSDEGGDYEVWFTREIPNNTVGPLEIVNIPGLVLEASSLGYLCRASSVEILPNLIEITIPQAN